MVVPPAVIVHGLADARVALAPGLPVTLLSAPGAALYAGCGWWQAMAALRIGVIRLVLWRGASGWSAVATIAAQPGGFVLESAPPALDLAQSGAGPRRDRQLHTWLTP